MHTFNDSWQIDHFWVAAMSKQVCARPFKWKSVSLTGTFSCKSNSLSYERFCTSTRFETEAQGNLEMAIQFQCNVKHTTLVKLLSLRDKLLPADLATLYTANTNF